MPHVYGLAMHCHWAPLRLKGGALERQCIARASPQGAARGGENVDFPTPRISEAVRPKRGALERQCIATRRPPRAGARRRERRFLNLAHLWGGWGQRFARCGALERLKGGALERQCIASADMRAHVPTPRFFSCAASPPNNYETQPTWRCIASGLWGGALETQGRRP